MYFTFVRGRQRAQGSVSLSVSESIYVGESVSPSLTILKQTSSNSVSDMYNW